MLRNTFYDRKKSVVHHWYYDEANDPQYKKTHFKPYLYIPKRKDGHVDAIGIDGVELSKKEFKNLWDRNEFVKNTKGMTYFNLPPDQQFLLEKYKDKDILDLTKGKLRIFYYDIEVIADEFPDPKTALFEMTSITVYDTLTQKYYVWGTKIFDKYSTQEYFKDDPIDVVYEFCPTERDLLKKFMKFWRANFPDLLVGYNSFSFDLPYIVHRIEKVFGEDKAKMLSPVNYLRGIEQTNKFGQEYMEYDIGGIAHLDYMVLYKTFTPGERESDSLDFVSSEELGVKKLDYEGLSLTELCRKDWNKFINYNIWDVKLLVMLEDKKRYLEIAKFSAFSGFCNLDKALGKVAIITGVLAKQALAHDKIISTQSGGVHEKIPGGFVKEPDIGMYENIMVMDLNSLYPNTIITLNISPETKIAKIVRKEPDIITLYFFKSQKMVDIPSNKFRDVVKAKNWALSSSGVLFSQDSMGICAEFADSLYKKRKKVKSKMLKLENSLEGMDKDSEEYKTVERHAQQLDVEQYLYKILLNSTYGVLANRFFALYDLDCAKSITLTGQNLIRESGKISNNIMEKVWDLPKADRVVAADTDSAIISIDDILKKKDVKIVDDNGDLTDEFVDIETRITEDLNAGVERWAVDTLNTKDCRFVFKRESACPKALWTAKKHYIMNIKNSEGVKMDKMKYKGMSVVKATYPDKTKTIIKGIVKDIFESSDRAEAEDKFFKAYNKFFTFDYKDISTRSSVKVLKKWKSPAGGFHMIKHTPQHVKASLNYNHLLEIHKVTNKYPVITDGKKIKICYVKPNKYEIDSVAYIDELPKEFNLEIDYAAMFNKCVVLCLTPIFEALSWNVPDPKKQVEVSFEELFG